MVFSITQYYAVGELSQALQANRRYRVSLYASSCDRFGAYVSDTALINPNPKTLLLIAGKMGGALMDWDSVIPSINTGTTTSRVPSQAPAGRGAR